MGYPNRVSHIFMPVGLEPEVRVWPKPPCAAGGRCSRGAWCAAVDKIEEKRKPEDFIGHRKRTPAPYKNRNCDTQLRFFYLPFYP